MIVFELQQTGRRVLQRPLLAAAVVATLALSIGASAVVFSLLYGVLLRPLPYPDQERLVRVYQTYDELRTSPNPRLQALWNRLPMSYLGAEELRGKGGLFSGVGLYLGESTTIDLGGEPVRVEGSRIDSDLLSVLGVEPLLGRGFSPGEGEAGERRVILGYGLWRQAFGGREDVLGETLRLEGEAFSVVGVMPRSFRLPGREEDRWWTPLRLTEEDRRERKIFAYGALARLGAGIRPPGSGRGSGPGVEVPATALEGPEGLGVRLVPLMDDVVGDHRPSLVLLLGAIALIFLIGCINVLHLFLAQGVARRREIAIHRALGAGWGSLARLQIFESLLLALGGGGIGLLLAFLGQQSLLAWIPEELPRRSEIALDGRAAAFALGLALLASLLCGLPAAWAGSRGRILDALAGGSSPRGGRRLSHEAFVVTQIALSLALVVGAGLLLRSFLRLSAVDPGFRTEGLLVQEVQLPDSRYGEAHRRGAFADDLLRELGSLPGIREVALTTKLPFSGRAFVWGFRIPGRDGETQENWVQGRSAAMKFVSTGYFRLLGLRLISGRGFNGADGLPGQRVVVVNETLARRHWPGASAVGQQVILGATEELYSVVGVVRDIRHDGLSAEPRELMYQPWVQGPAPALVAVMDVEGEPAAQAPAIRRAIRHLDSRLPLAPTTALGELLRESLRAPRSRTALMACLAGLALLLAAAGTFAVLSFTVQRRLPEMGVRMVLGATAAGVRRRVLRRTLGIVLLGIALGTPAALMAAGLLKNLLFGVAPGDPLTFAGAAVLLVLTGLAAGLPPARRAGRVDPMGILRGESDRGG